MSTFKRCCNLDWFEIFALEPLDVSLDADYFRAQGIFVQERDYGTRVFQQMFTLEDKDGHAWLEVRRAPASADVDGGILPVNACHLRLTNRACYVDGIVAQLSAFMEKHGYDFQTITRVDVCLDFTKFDTGDKPRDFARRYIQGVYAKINQGNIHAHGTDAWTGQTWNSLSWGKPTSQVSTKLYCKTQELIEVGDKPYIRQAWFESGLVDNPYTYDKRDEGGNIKTQEVWRLEFSIRSGRKGWYTVEQDGNERDYHSYRNDLSAWWTRELCFQKFASLVPHYFRFKYFKEGVKKHLCEDKPLFRFKQSDTCYHLERVARVDNHSTLERQLKAKLEAFRQRHFENDIRQAVDILLDCIHNGEIRSDFGSPFSRAELFAIRGAISRKMAGDDRDPSSIINELKLLFESTGEIPF